MRGLGLLLLAFVATASPAWGQRYGKAVAEPNRPPNFDAIGIDQKLGEQVPLGLIFRDEHDKEVTLGSCVGGKATVLVLAYYRCPMLCNQVLNGVVETLKKMPGDIGNQFNVVTVSFDPKDKWATASVKKDSYLKEYGRAGADKGWHFLTGEQPAIDELCQAVGFRYEFDKEKKQYNHASGIMVITPYGKLSRYFFGIAYDEKELQTALEDAGAEKIGKEVDPGQLLKMLCYEFNPVTGKYTLSVMKGLRIVFGTMLLVLGFWLIRVWRRPPNVLKTAPPAATAE
ncbi:MAG: SCO family protein [Planctomycetes bacterium]|nr:SCO family protein [Planctomycetota bacterium]